MTRRSFLERTGIVAILTMAVGVGTLPSPAHAQSIAITNGTVFTGAGERIEHGTVLIVDGRIHAVGPAVEIPDGTERIDATGKWITPGLLAFDTQLGLVEIGSVAETREGSRTDDAVTPSFNVLEGINPASQLIPVTRIDGITTALSVPSGGLIGGQAVLVDLAGDDIETMLVRSPAAMAATVNRSAKVAPAVPGLQ